jgi:hypothetical protein
MSRFTSIAAALLVSATTILAQADTAPQPPDIAGLVRQLGSRRFREREAASRGQGHHVKSGCGRSDNHGTEP